MFQKQFRHGLALVCLLLVASSSSAGLLEDDEARRAILDLRQRMDTVKQEQAANDRKVAEDTAQLQRSILDLQNQLEATQAEMAKLRGQNEQLARDVSEMQRRLKDTTSSVDERLRKFEPLSVTVDGREFVVDPAERRDYEANLALFRKGDFAGATNGFVDFLSRNPQTGYRPSALFWLGSAQYAGKDCKSAMVNFRSLIALAPEHVHAPEAMLTTANCQLEAKDTKAARKSLETVIAKYPATDAANTAKDRLSRLK